MGSVHMLNVLNQLKKIIAELSDCLSIEITFTTCSGVLYMFIFCAGCHAFLFYVFYITTAGISTSLTNPWLLYTLQ